MNGPTPNIEEGVELEWLQGGPEKLRHLRDDEAIVSDDFAKEHDLEVGDKFSLLSQSEAAAEVHRRGRVRIEGWASSAASSSPRR